MIVGCEVGLKVYLDSYSVVVVYLRHLVKTFKQWSLQVINIGVNVSFCLITVEVIYVAFIVLVLVYDYLHTYACE